MNNKDYNVNDPNNRYKILTHRDELLKLSVV